MVGQNSSIIIIEHKNANSDFLTRIAKVKDLVWPHGIDSQLLYIKKNTSPNDEHALVCGEGKDLGYLCIKKTSIYINQSCFGALGVSGLCTIPEVRGKGVGRFLIEVFHNKCKSSNLPGILFCKDKVLAFYKNLGWKKLNLKYRKRLYQNHFMVYNLSVDDDVIVVFKELLF